MNSSFPNRWSFSYLIFTKYVTNIIAEPKYKYGQLEQVTVRNHNRSTTLERSVLQHFFMEEYCKLSLNYQISPLMSHVVRKPVLWVCNQVSVKLACSATEASYCLKSCNLARTGILLSMQWITKVLVRLHRFAGWYAPLSFAYDKTGFLMMWLNSMSLRMTKPTKWHLRAAKTDQTGHPPGMIEFSLCAQLVAEDPSFLHADSEDWSDWADAQADQSLRWAHSHFFVLLWGGLSLYQYGTG